ncbi:MAG: metallophosphoesterase [Hominilimicola sp.]
MIAIYISPLYVLLNLYILWRLIKWTKDCGVCKKTRIIISLLYALFALAVLIGFFMPSGTVKRMITMTGNYWLGVMLYALLVIVTADIIRLILKHCKRINHEKLFSKKAHIINGAVCLVIIASVSVYGAVNASVIRTQNYEITVNKKAENVSSLNAVLIADMHMGYNIGCRQMQQMADKINALNPDIVLIAGDIFDNEYDALENPDELIGILKSIKSKYGIYACYGNHDISEKILAGFTFSHKNNKEKVSDIRMDEFLEKADIHLLKDEYVLIDNSFYVYGRPDAERPGRGVGERKTPEHITENLDMSKPILVLDHEPSELQELADAGVDVDLCGHTHDGQMFPGNLTINLFWENACGYLKKGNMHNIVTSGVGLFGPNMRVGTAAEICSIKINFND